MSSHTINQRPWRATQWPDRTALAACKVRMTDSVPCSTRYQIPSRPHSRHSSSMNDSNFAETSCTIASLPYQSNVRRPSTSYIQLADQSPCTPSSVTEETRGLLLPWPCWVPVSILITSKRGPNEYSHPLSDTVRGHCILRTLLWTDA